MNGATGLRSGAARRENRAAGVVASWVAWWESLQPRERHLLVAGAAIVGAAVLWFVALRPPLKVLREAPARLDEIDAQLLTMRRLAVETRELRAAPQVSDVQSLAALRTASARLEPAAKLSIRGDRAVLTMDGLGGDSLRAWLAEVRSGARARPVEAQLLRGPKGFSGTITVAVGESP